MNITIALVGNPNSGKTTIFNDLTGGHQHVANYPGVTVEKKEARLRHAGHDITLVDLPGTYSLTAYSAEEIITRNYIVEERPDVVVDIVDASNLERNLYLTTQLIELGVPLALAFNMSDIVEARGEKIDRTRLSGLLGAPIARTVGTKKEGILEMLDLAIEVAVLKRNTNPGIVKFGREIEEEIERLEKALSEQETELGPYKVRWTALKLLENDSAVRERFSHPALLEAVDRSRAHLQRVFGDAPEIIVPERRYGFISGACQECVTSTVEFRHTMSDKIDAVTTHPLFGIPIFLALMYLMFQLVFKLGEPAVQGVEYLVEQLGAGAAAMLPDGYLQSVIVDGIIGGVGGVLVFLPNILLLFLGIAILEDSGYMARAAFVMDNLMHKIGLHGKSFIPMLLGLGCSVPGVMSTRILEDRHDRIATILVVPLMSCSAKLPVYTLLAGAFFADANRGRAIFSIYVLGIVLAVLLAKLFRRFVVPGPTVPFVIELPPYRVPTIRGALIHTWDRGKMFLKKAGTVILAASILIWALSRFPTRTDAAGQPLPPAEQLQSSYAGQIGHALAPMLRPVGLGDWRVATSLLFGVSAKEIVVSTMGTFYNLGEQEEGSEALRDALRADPAFNPLKAYALMVFVLIYVPCIPTIVVVGRETGSWWWALFHVIYTTLLAWLMCFIVYQGGLILGFGV